MEKYYKYICWVLTLICIVLVTIIWHDYELDKLRNQLDIQTQISNNLAVSLSNVNNMLQKDSSVILQVNRVLTTNGYSKLVRKEEK